MSFRPVTASALAVLWLYKRSLSPVFFCWALAAGIFRHVLIMRRRPFGVMALRKAFGWRFRACRGVIPSGRMGLTPCRNAFPIMAGASGETATGRGHAAEIY